MSYGISREQIERVVRMYKSNQDASRALGITIRSFSRLCHKYQVESPHNRRRRTLAECRARRVHGHAARAVAAG